MWLIVIAAELPLFSPGRPFCAPKPGRGRSLSFAASPVMKVKVTNSRYIEYEIEVDGSDPVAVLKDKIFDVEGTVELLLTIYFLSKIVYVLHLRRPEAL
jgi:hypothetical protein